MDEQKANWYVKCELTVIGPDEGPVRAIVEFDATTRALATEIQSDLAAYFTGKNVKVNDGA